MSVHLVIGLVFALVVSVSLNVVLGRELGRADRRVALLRRHVERLIP